MDDDIDFETSAYRRLMAEEQLRLHNSALQKSELAVAFLEERGGEVYVLNGENFISMDAGDALQEIAKTIKTSESVIKNEKRYVEE